MESLDPRLHPPTCMSYICRMRIEFVSLSHY